jgi:uncharacterized protein
MLRFVMATIVGASFSLGAALPSFAQQSPTSQQSSSTPVDPAALAAAHRLMTASHMNDAMNAMVQAMIPQMIQSIGHAQGLSQPQMTMVSRIVREEMVADTPRLIDMMAQLYAVRLSSADLNAAADFYETDAGKHFIASQAQLSADGVAIGRAWGQQLVPRVVARIAAEAGTPGGTQP